MKLISKEFENIKGAYDTSINLVDGLPFNQKETIRQIEFYSNSKYLNGQKDELGREKPFYNILNAMCDVEDAAKDIDTKDISIVSDDSNHYLEAFLMSKEVYEWMKESNFAKTLNDIRSQHTRYGSVLVKKVTKEGELTIATPEWKNVIADQVDIANGAIVETHYMTPAELLKKSSEGWKCSDIAWPLMEKGLSKRVSVYEVRGEFPKAFIKDAEGKKASKKDMEAFSYQLYYLCEGKEGLQPVYWEDDTERVYKYLSRKPKAGRSFGVGVLEEGFEAQIWTNDAVLKQSRAMEFTSKVVGQTASKKLKGRNIMTEVDDGQILEHEDGKPITTLNLLPSGGLGQYQGLLNQWYAQFEKTTSAYAAQRGETQPSGTPFRLQALVLQQSSSVFDDLREDLGIFITEIFEDWVIPHLSKQLNRAHILSHEFSAEELREIDERFAMNKANKMAKEAVLSGQIVSPAEYAEWIDTAKDLIAETKSQRFLDIPKDFYKSFKAKVTVNVTGEQRNKAATLESLINIMSVYAKNPAMAQDPVLMKIFSKIVELSGAGISPVELEASIRKQSEAVPIQPTEAPVEEMSLQALANGQPA